MKVALTKIAAACALASVLVCIGTPCAYADYTEVADSYGTVTSVEPLSSAIAGSEIPDGTYTDCDSRTSSSYFKLYDLSIVVEDGVITLRASASASYTAIAMGEAEEVAAACTPDELSSDAVDISHGALFSMDIAALNSSFEVATYSKSREVWYTRTICIDALEGSQVQKAILKAKADAETDSETGDKTDGDDPEGKDSDGDDSGKDSSQQSTKKSTGDDEDDEQKQKSSAAGSKKSGTSSGKSASTATSTSNSASNGKTNNSASNGSKTASKATTQKKSQTNSTQATKRDPNTRKFFSGQLRKVNFEGDGLGEDAVKVKSNDVAENYVDANALAVQIVAFVCMVLLVVGFAVRVLLFRSQSTRK